VTNVEGMDRKSDDRLGEGDGMMRGVFSSCRHIACFGGWDGELCAFRWGKGDFYSSIGGSAFVRGNPHRVIWLGGGSYNFFFKFRVA